jgi:hypothetical protein
VSLAAASSGPTPTHGVIQAFSSTKVSADGAPGDGVTPLEPTGNQLSTVTVTDPEPFAVEDPTGTPGVPETIDPGDFRITRTGSTAEQLTVFFTLGGTAQNGVDYVTITSFAVIPAGKKFVDIPVVPYPRPPLSPVPMVNVTLTLNSSDNYGIGKARNSEIFIYQDGSFLGSGGGNSGGNSGGSGGGNSGGSGGGNSGGSGGGNSGGSGGGNSGGSGGGNSGGSGGHGSGGSGGSGGGNSGGSGGSTPVTVSTSPTVTFVTIATPPQISVALGSGSQHAGDMFFPPPQQQVYSAGLPLDPDLRDLPAGLIPPLRADQVALVGGTNAQGQISGKIFDDITGTGAVDKSKPGLPGVTVFLDLNNNGMLDEGEPTTTTDDRGEYAFTGLQAGTYIVRQAMPGNVLQTLPANEAPYEVTLERVSDAAATDRNFGLQLLSGRGRPVAGPPRRLPLNPPKPGKPPSYLDNDDDGDYEGGDGDDQSPDDGADQD